MKQLVEIFVTFFRVGLFTFGGGYAMLPIVKKEIIEKKDWITQEQLLDYYGVAQVSMGIIAINTSALIGYQVAKKKGALVAGFASALPSILIITIIAFFLESFMQYPQVLNVFKMIRIVVAALIVNTAYTLGKKGIIDWIGVVLFGISFVLITFVHVNPIFLILFSAVVGIYFKPKAEVKA